MEKTIDQDEINRRKNERFDMHVPATVAVGKNELVLQLYTRDISPSGAYFLSSHNLQEGLKVKIEMVLENATMKALTGSQCFIRFYGTVIRRESHGIAVSFNGHEKIMTVRSSMTH